MTAAARPLEDLAARVAHIIGPQSAAAQALKELRNRRSAGEPVELWRNGGAWVVARREDVP